MRILVTGGTGFVGPSIVQALVDAGHTVRVLEHESGRSAELPSQEAVQGDVTDPASLLRAVEGQEVVVHLVALLAGPPEEFQQVMEQGTRDLVAAAKDAGVQRFVLMSALGVDEQTKELVPYYHAKWEMEQTVKSSGLEHVIFRPSFIFGPGGGALQQFARIAKRAPITPIVGPGTQRIQPIWIDDLAAYFAAGVEKPEAANRTFELGGPDTVDVERVLVAPEECARNPAAGGPSALRPHAGTGRRAREAAQAAGHARPAEDARGRRQRRLEHGRRRHVRPSARPPGRATPPRHHLTVPDTTGPGPDMAVADTAGPGPDMAGNGGLSRRRAAFAALLSFGTSLYW